MPCRLLSFVLASVALQASAQVAPPAPVGPVPTEAQLAWHALEYYGFLHFTVNTFTDREWGNGDEPETVFNPTALDVKQWVAVAKQAGMRGLILTAKHHDGFCLWPSKYTEHSLKKSPYKDGQGDIVGDLATACKEAGLEFGVYLSPWDRNHAEYGRPAYVEYFQNQLRELLTQYGPVREVWFDGANGGTGYYGGANEERKIDRTTYYDWKNTWALVRELQPGAVLFSDVGPDIRWVGNERGYAGDPCWATYTPHPREAGQPAAPGLTMYEEAVHGHVDGEHWMPAEVDVSIRPGWFYHEEENEKVRSAANLMEIYYESVGRGASLLLNVPPDRRGLIHERDAQALFEFRALRDGVFSENRATSSKYRITADARGNAEAYKAEHVLDEDRTTYWATDDGVTQATLEIEFRNPQTFNNVLLQEYVELGQRVTKFTLEARVKDAWQKISEGTSIGWKRIVRTPTVTATAVRLRIDEAKACPTISTFGLYLGPEIPAEK